MDRNSNYYKTLESHSSEITDLVLNTGIDYAKEHFKEPSVEGLVIVAHSTFEAGIALLCCSIAQLEDRDPEDAAELLKPVREAYKDVISRLL